MRYGSRRQLITLGIILVVGIGARLGYVGRPFDYRIVNSWRQADYFQLTRNFYREGRSILYPQIDWRGDTPGFAEMELPLMPWFGAQIYRLIGPHDQVLRFISATFAIINLLLFTLLARKILPPLGSTVAVGFFAVNPVLIVLSTAMQPEPLMHSFVLASALTLWIWWKSDQPAALVSSGFFLGLGILSKLSAAYFGLVVAYFVLRKLRIRAAVTAEVIVAGLLAVVPPTLWYVWAHRFWTEFGISLGLSNESHWIGLDLLVKPLFVIGILKWETILVLTPVGWILLVFAARLPWTRIEFPTVWFAAAFIFYVAAARTTGDYWAWYYHLLSVAPAAILMGAGAEAMATGAPTSPRIHRIPSARAALTGTLVLIALAIDMAVSAALVFRRDFEHQNLRSMYNCSKEFADYVKPTEMIVVRGGPMFDDTGRPVAHDESMIFAWMDRKGFCYGDEELGASTLTAIAERGGTFWMVNREEIASREQDDHLESMFRSVASCEDVYLLFDLREPVPSSAGSVP